MFKNITAPRKHRGFTLVELLTVMLVLVAVASITVEVSSDLAFQNRYEITKDRYEKIKRAIIGRPDVLINGQPDISGFVADVGRLPFALQELLDGHYCPDTQYFNQTTCDAALGAGKWVVTPNWNGPYIASVKAFNDSRALSDGWGNTGSGNYGWAVSYKDNGGLTTTTVANIDSMSLQSLGKNGVAGGTNYDADYPNVPDINAQDYSVLFVAGSGITVNINKNFNMDKCIFDPAVVNTFITQESCEVAGGAWSAPNCILDSTSCTAKGALWSWNAGTSMCENTIRSKTYCESSGGSWKYNTIMLRLDIDGSVSTNTVTIDENGLNQPVEFTFAADTSIPIGRHTINIVDTATLATYPPGHATLTLSFIPSTIFPTINW